MEGKTRKLTSRALPWGLIGMFGLVLAAERFVLQHDRDLTTMVPLNWRLARRAATTGARECKVLCLGSSIVKFGIGARIITAQTGSRALNLAMSAASLPPNYFLLKRALDAGARPTAIIVDCLDDGFAPYQLQANLRNFPELLSIKETLELTWLARDSDLLATILLERLFPSFKNRFEIRKLMLAAFRGEEGSLEHESRVVERQWRRNRGTCVVPRNLDFEAKHRGEPAPVLPAAGPHVARAAGPLRTHYAPRFLELAAAYKVRVFYLLPPLPPHTLKSWARSGTIEERTREAEELQAHYPGMIVLDGRRSGYPVAAFYDDVHLNAQGATALSVDVGSVMKQTGDGAQGERLWVTLPPYRELGADPRLEDVINSGLVSKARSTSRR
jgi:hypothetical protein